jgi:ent-kaurenoic acid hydroxylase
MFRTHLFGVPSVIVYSASVHKYVLHNEDIFKAEWPTIELMGRTSMVAVHGKAHTRVRSFVTNAINRPDALNRIAALVQPRMVIALRSWAQMGKINARFETQKVFIYILIYIKLIHHFSVCNVLETKSINFNIL